MDSEDRFSNPSPRYETFRNKISYMQDQVDVMQRIVDTLSSGSEFTVRVTDHTLMPFIEPNDMMIFVSTNYEKMRVGDFVLYRLNDGRPAVRRVIRKCLIDGHAAVICRSDLDHNEKDQVRAAQVLGRLAFIERHGRRIKGSRLNRGLIDWATSFGTRHPLAKLGDLFMMLIPIRRRATPAIDATKVDAPVLKRKGKLGHHVKKK